MKKINGMEGLESLSCVSERIDLSSLPKVETSVFSGRVITVNPVTPLPVHVNGGVVDVSVDGSTAEWTSLKESFMRAIVSIVRIENGEERNLNVGEKISYEANILYGLFTTIRCAINDIPVSGESDNLQHYAAALGIITFLNKRTQNSILSTAGLYWSTPGGHEETDPTVQDGKNLGLKQRFELGLLSLKTSLVGPLLIPLAFSHRLLPPNTEIKFSFSLNTPGSTLIAVKGAGAVPNYAIKLHALEIYIQRYRLFQQVEDRIWRGLGKKSSCLYPVAINKMTSFVLESGSDSASKILTLGGNGRLPRMLVVGLLDRDNISTILSPKYDFGELNVDELYASIDDVKFPSIPYRPNINSGMFSLAYYQSLREGSYINDDPIFGKEGFDDGYTIYPIALEAGRSNQCEFETLRPSETGTLVLHVKLGMAARRAIIVMVLCVYHQTLSLGLDRIPKWVE